jgi:hypothetical protein
MPPFTASAWFGSQLGASAWLLVSAIAAIRVSWGIALGLFGLFVGLNLIGWGLWRGRERIAPLVAIESLILAAGLAAVPAMVLLTRTDLLKTFDQPSNPWPFLVVFPLLMLMFAGQAWARKRGAD